jgi:transposase
MDDALRRYEELLGSGAKRLKGHQRRLFQAEVCLALCGGNAREAESRFGWGRGTVSKGIKEYQSGIRCLENFGARGRRRAEDLDPDLAEDIRAVVSLHSYADPELKTSRRYSNLTAKEVREALMGRGYREQDLPAERTMRDVLNRMNFRLKRVVKGKPLKKTKDTDAIFANLAAVREEVRGDPATLEISVDTKAKVAVGDYVRGGKMPNQ